MENGSVGRLKKKWDMNNFINSKNVNPILGLQPRDKAAMLVVKTKEIFLLNLHQNRVHFPAERNAFVLDHQHGRRDVTCKPAIQTGKGFCPQRLWTLITFLILQHMLPNLVIFSKNYLATIYIIKIR